MLKTNLQLSCLGQTDHQALHFFDLGIRHPCFRIFTLFPRHCLSVTFPAPRVLLYPPWDLILFFLRTVYGSSSAFHDCSRLGAWLQPTQTRCHNMTGYHNMGGGSLILQSIFRTAATAANN